MPRVGKDLLGDRHVLPCRQHDDHVTVYFKFCMVIVKWVSNAEHAASNLRGRGILQELELVGCKVFVGVVRPFVYTAFVHDYGPCMAICTYCICV